MITFYSDNLVESATLTASTENALFPVENIQDDRRTKVFRSTANSDNVVLDFGSAKDIDSILVTSNPVSGFGFTTITIEANSSNSWGAPPFSQAITVNTQYGIGLYELATPISYRYVRVVMTSGGSYCELSNLFIGEKITPSRGLNYGWTNKNDDLVQTKENRFGQKFSDIIGRQRIISGTIQNLTDANIDLIRAVVDAKGKHRPFFVKVGCQEAMSDPYRFIAMVYFSTIPNESNRFYKNWGLTLQFEEAK